MALQGEGLQSLPAVLCISGSDSSGAAGMQIDLKTVSAFGCRGLSAISAATAQSWGRVISLNPLPPAALRDQIDGAWESIAKGGLSLERVAVKVGMLASAENAHCVALALEELASRVDAPLKIVVDPVIESSSGSPLLEPSGYESLFRILEIPSADVVITPNIPEAEKLSGVAISGEESRVEAAQALLERGAWGVLLKGGHDSAPSAQEASTDLLAANGAMTRLKGRRFQGGSVRGTGCALSAALAALLAKGKPLEEAAKLAKEFVAAALFHSSPTSFTDGRGETIRLLKIP